MPHDLITIDVCYDPIFLFITGSHLRDNEFLIDSAMGENAIRTHCVTPSGPWLWAGPGVKPDGGASENRPEQSRKG